MVVNSSLQAGLFGLLVTGFGMGAGGIVAYLIKGAKTNLIPIFVSFAVGITYNLVLLEIIPESMEIGGILPSLFGLFLGFFMVYGMERMFHRVIIITSSAKKDIFLRTVLLLLIAITLHNFPTGVALGTGLLETPDLAVKLAVVMFFHTIPEGLAVGIPLMLADFDLFSIFKSVTIVSIPTGIGAFLGYVFGIVFPSGLALLLGLASGTILMVSFVDILIPAWKDAGIHTGLFGLSVGWLLGLILLFLIK